jgi:hypothetical protein
MITSASCRTVTLISQRRRHGPATPHRGRHYAKRRFAVRDYNARGNDLLNIYGSVTAGSLSATEPRYRTKIRFDRRLETLRPPSFPMTDRYEVESWDNEWKVEQARTAL